MTITSHPDIQQDQKDFLRVCSVECFNIHEVLHGVTTLEREEQFYKAIALARKLIHEEVNIELIKAIDKYQKLVYENSLVPIDGGFQSESFPLIQEILDGVVDSVYVLMQLVNTLDLPFEEAWLEIQHANMSKAIPDGLGLYKVKKNQAGKVMKPEGWVPPDMKTVIIEHLEAYYEKRKKEEIKNDKTATSS